MDVRCSISMRVKRFIRGCIVGMWMVPQTPMVSTIKGLIWQPSAHNLARIRLLFCILCVMKSFGSMS